MLSVLLLQHPNNLEAPPCWNRDGWPVRGRAGSGISSCMEPFHGSLLVIDRELYHKLCPSAESRLILFGWTFSRSWFIELCKVPSVVDAFPLVSRGLVIWCPLDTAASVIHVVRDGALVATTTNRRPTNEFVWQHLPVDPNTGEWL